MAGRRSRDSGLRSVAEIVLHAPRSAKVLVLGVFVNRATAFFATFLVLFLRQAGFSVGEMPLVLLLVGVATPVGSVLAGWASDRFRREDVLLGCTVAAAASLGAVALVHDRAALVGAVVAAALLTQAYLPPAQTLLLEQTDDEDRVPIAAFFRLALNAGVAIGAVLALLVGAARIRWLFAIDCVGYLLFALILRAGLDGASRRTRSAEAERVEEPAEVESTAGRPGLGTAAALFLGIGLNAIVYIQYSSTVAIAVADAHGAAAYAALLIVNGGLVILGELPLASFTRRLEWRWPLVAGTACMAIGIAISGAFRPLALVVLGWVTWTVGEMLFSPVVIGAVSRLAAPSRRGRYQGYLAFVQSVAFALGPPLGVLIYSHSPGALWAACLGCGVLGCAAIAVTAGAGPRRTFDVGTSRARS